MHDTRYSSVADHGAALVDAFELAGVRVAWTRHYAPGAETHVLSVYGRAGDLLERSAPLSRADADLAFETMHATLSAVVSDAGTADVTPGRDELHGPPSDVGPLRRCAPQDDAPGQVIAPPFQQIS